MITEMTDQTVLSGSTERERINTVIVKHHDDLTALVADRIVDVILRAVARKRYCVLGLATGSTPVGVYQELIRRHRAGEVSFTNVVTFNLDEYYPMPAESPHSYRRFMWENFFEHIDIRPENVHIPDGTTPRDAVAAACRTYEANIHGSGGVDFQILGIGKTGHIGFNEPGSARDSRTRLVTLDLVTRKDAAADFFGVDNVPREALTMGVATILEAQEIALLATGEHKATIIQRAVEGEPSGDVAATFLQEHPKATMYLDQPAAEELTRVATPWLLEPVEWTPAMTERAVVWLSEQTDKAILKLRARDYAEHHLSPLLSQHDSPGVINGDVFNILRDKIRGRARLPKNQRVIVFSPHPDDDVISMGGALYKLTQNGNDIIVAYMTSGNIAVFDHDVRRYLDFAHRAASALGVDASTITDRWQEVEESFSEKKPGDVDIALVQDLKRTIREGEAVSAIEAIGLPATAARFLNLPFYQTGQVRKLPIGDEDVRIVRELLEEVRPDFIFVAGDLSDPHGTHRMCMAAIDQALDGFPAPVPDVWLYRGAWQEWSLTDADVLTPLSFEELRVKVGAIFKHESQKDAAPFPGPYDEREFWQRVVARNRETAAKADHLGLPEYYAMEAYVVKKGGQAVE